MQERKRIVDLGTCPLRGAYPPQLSPLTAQLRLTAVQPPAVKAKASQPPHDLLPVQVAAGGGPCVVPSSCALWIHVLIGDGERSASRVQFSEILQSDVETRPDRNDDVGILRM